MAETRYAQCGDLSLAYHAVGQGEKDLVVANSFISHLEVDGIVVAASFGSGGFLGGLASRRPPTPFRRISRAKDNR